MPLLALQALVASSQADMSHLRDTQISSQQKSTIVTRSEGSAETGTIDIPTPETDIGFCISVTGLVVGIAQATYQTLNAVISAAEYTCLQQVAAESASIACTVLEIAAVSAEFVYREGDFCRDETRAAKGEAILQLDRNVGAFFNDAINQNIMSSRATQNSVDIVTTDTLIASGEITDIQDIVDSNFITINNDLNLTLAQLANLSNSLTDLISESGDIRFRSEVNQVNIEDIQTRTADLQESGDDIRQDTQNLITASDALQTSINNLSNAVTTEFAQINRDEIARALTNPDYIVPAYVTPAAQGGQLEQAREVVIEAIQLINNISPGNTREALNLLIQGDMAYNNQNYLSAYTLFAQAYQAIGPVSTFR